MRRDDGYEMESWGETLSAVFVRVLITFAVLIDGAASGLAGCVWGTAIVCPFKTNVSICTWSALVRLMAADNCGTVAVADGA
jgi:hypothetical protein